MINHDIVPLLAFSPSMLRKRRDELRTKDGVYRMNITAGKVSFDGKKKVGILDFVDALADHLPDMELHAHMHDMGPYLLDELYRRELEKAVDEGRCESDRSIPFCLLLQSMFRNRLDMMQDQLVRLEYPKRNDRVGALNMCRNDSPSVARVSANLSETAGPSQNHSCEPISSLTSILFSQYLFILSTAQSNSSTTSALLRTFATTQLCSRTSASTKAGIPATRGTAHFSFKARRTKVGVSSRRTLSASGRTMARS